MGHVAMSWQCFFTRADRAFSASTNERFRLSIVPARTWEWAGAENGQPAGSSDTDLGVIQAGYF